MGVSKLCNYQKSTDLDVSNFSNMSGNEVSNYFSSMSNGSLIHENSSRYPQWAININTKISDLNIELDRKYPENRAQALLHKFYNLYLDPLLNHQLGQKLNEVLDSKCEGDWYKKLGSYLVKLPLKSIRNILNLVYNVIKASVFGLVHPLKAMTEVPAFIVSLIVAMQNPEFYISAGAGIIGSVTSQCVFTGLFLPGAISLAVGALLLGVGLSWDALKTLDDSLEDASLGKVLWKDLDLIFQSFTTGVITGSLVSLTRATRVATHDEAYAQFYKYLDQHHYRSCFNWSDYYPDSHRIMWSWVGGRPPAHFPSGSWESVWEGKTVTYSAIDIHDIILPPSVAKTVAAQALAISASN